MSEVQAPTWRVVNKWAGEQIELHRDALEASSLPEKETENLRGRIAELRALLALTDSKPEVPEGNLADSE